MTTIKFRSLETWSERRQREQRERRINRLRNALVTAMALAAAFGAIVRGRVL